MQSTTLRRAVAGALITGAAALVGAAPAAAQFTPGSSGLGDPFFPFAGNGGYDVRHYSLDLDYVRATNHLVGEAELHARATQSLSSFNVDLRGFTITDLEVDDRNATFSRSGQELTVTPRRGIRRGEKFELEIDYNGTPERVIDPDGSSEGWVPTSDGAYVVNEPQGSPGWYPANDNPRDKATYDFEVTVPEGITVIGNGRLLDKDTRNGKTTWHWYEDSPMAPYLTTVTNGEFELRVSKWRNVPIYHAVDPKLDQAAWTQFAREPEILEFFSDLYGPYPFSTSGGIVDDGRVGYALESQTRSNYDRVLRESTHAHEIAHQWFGNAVTLTVWPDIWLNEGFATWSEWAWDEHDGGDTAAEAFRSTYAAFEDWDPAPAALPGPEVMFTSPPYDRGAMTLQALREKIGDRDFFRLLRTWYRDNKDGNVTTADFIRLAERTSRRQLDEFFHVWLFRPEPAPAPEPL